MIIIRLDNRGRAVSPENKWVYFKHFKLLIMKMYDLDKLRIIINT